MLVLWPSNFTELQRARCTRPLARARPNLLTYPSHRRENRVEEGGTDAGIDVVHLLHWRGQHRADDVDDPIDRLNIRQFNRRPIDHNLAWLEQDNLQLLLIHREEHRQARQVGRGDRVTDEMILY
jgi:hypothetical protein